MSLENDKKEIEKISHRIFGYPPTFIQALPKSGSNRQYYRIWIRGCSYILCISSNKKENITFIRLSDYFRKKRLAVPRVYGYASDFETYITEDLGDTDLMKQLHSGKRTSEEVWGGIRMSIGQLAQFQLLNIGEWESLVEFDPFNKDLIRYDCKYAEENLIKISGVQYDKVKLKKDFENLEKKLLEYPLDYWGLMYRDFQSRNIMMSPTPYFIDYQSARFGPGIYDLVSFAWQARAAFNKEERMRIIEYYIISRFGNDTRGAQILKNDLPHWAIFRILQTLGAYGLRGLKEGKRHFIESIPFALSNITEILKNELQEDSYPEIRKIMENLKDLVILQKK